MAALEPHRELTGQLRRLFANRRYCSPPVQSLEITSRRPGPNASTHAAMPPRSLSRRTSGRLARSPARVAILAAGVDAQTAAAEELEGVGTFRYSESFEALSRLVDRNGVDVIVTEPRDIFAIPASSCSSSVCVSAHQISLSLFIRLQLSPAAVQEMPAALGAGATDFSIRGFDRLGEVVRGALAIDRPIGVSTPLLYLMRWLVPPDLEEFVIVCALKGSARLTPSLVSGWIRVKERTLRHRLQHALAHVSSVFIEFATAVHAAYTHRTRELRAAGGRRANEVRGNAVAQYPAQKVRPAIGARSEAARWVPADATERLCKLPRRPVPGAGRHSPSIDRYLMRANSVPSNAVDRAVARGRTARRGRDTGRTEADPGRSAGLRGGAEPPTSRLGRKLR